MPINVSGEPLKPAGAAFGKVACKRMASLNVMLASPVDSARQRRRARQRSQRAEADSTGVNSRAGLLLPVGKQPCES